MLETTSTALASPVPRFEIPAERRALSQLRQHRAAGIAGLGAALPGRVVDNAEIAERIGVAPEWIVRRTGIASRRRIGDDESITELSGRAATQALDQAGIAAADLDAVLVATSSAEALMPHASPVLVSALGATRAMTWDIGLACTGFLAGLEQGAALVESGRAETVLLVAVDALSRFVDHDDRATAALFGDAAGAVVITAGGAWRIGESVLRADATDADALNIPHATRIVQMDGQLVFQRALAGMESACREVLHRSGLTIDDIDLVVPHQANARSARRAARRRPRAGRLEHRRRRQHRRRVNPTGAHRDRRPRARPPALHRLRGRLRLRGDRAGDRRAEPRHHRMTTTTRGDTSMSAITDTTAIQTRVFSALEELDVDPEKISRDADFAALDVDSLDLAELATIVDDEYGVKLRSDDMKALKTVGDVIDLVVARTA